MESNGQLKHSSRGRWLAWVGLFLVLAVGALVRWIPASQVFTPEGVRFAADGDTYYHALRSAEIARSWPQVTWFDRGLNYPVGAAIPWPPLLDQLIATLAVATGPPTADHVARLAAVVPTALGLAVIALVAGIGVALRRKGPWLYAALLTAVLPGISGYSSVGRPDHHVLESLLAALCLYACLRGMKRGEPIGRWAMLLALGLTLGFWNWTGSPIYLLLLAGFVAVQHLLAPAADPSAERAAELLAVGGGVAALGLTASIAAWGPPGALAGAELSGISGLAPVLALLAGLAAALLRAARRFDPRAGRARRAAHVLLAGFLPLALVLLASAPLRESVGRGLTALGRGNPWYACIEEFYPLLFSGLRPWDFELRQGLARFGLAPLLLLPAPVIAWRVWRTDLERRPRLLLFFLWGAAVLVLAAARRRFDVYAAVPLTLAGAVVLWRGAALLSRRFACGREWATHALCLAGALLVCAPVLKPVVAGAIGFAPPGVNRELVPLLGVVSRLPPSAPGREAVIASWAFGHHIRWFTGKPVLASPFGSEGGPRALEDHAAFLSAPVGEGLEDLLRRRRAGFLLLNNPAAEVEALWPLTSGGAPSPVRAVRGWRSGLRLEPSEAFWDLAVARLYFFDGTFSGQTVAAVPSARLLAETPSPSTFAGLVVPAYKLFGIVEGSAVTVRGASPGALVTATTEVTTNIGRTFRWESQSRADGTGTAVLRLPYATGENGLTVTSRYVVGDGQRWRPLSLSEEQVATGAHVTADLAE